jgi:hypothetical protein
VVLRLRHGSIFAVGFRSPIVIGYLALLMDPAKNKRKRKARRKAFETNIVIAILLTLWEGLGQCYCTAFVPRIRPFAKVEHDLVVLLSLSPPVVRALPLISAPSKRLFHYDHVLIGLCRHKWNQQRLNSVGQSLSVSEIQEKWNDHDKDDKKKPENVAFYDEVAKYAFARRHFYYDKEYLSSEKSMNQTEVEDARWQTAQSLASTFQVIRNDKFQELSVREVLKKDNVQQLLSTVGIFAFEDRIKPLLTVQTIEEKLSQLVFIALNEGEEVEKYKNNKVVLTNQNAIVGAAIDRVKVSRHLSIMFVLGSSGSGKTFLALELANSFKQPHRKQLKRVTLYLHPAKFFADLKVKINDNDLFGPVNHLVKWMLDAVRVRIYETENLKKLNMHVSVVLDEAGSPALNGYFEKSFVLSHLVTMLQQYARSISVIVTGTGVTATTFSSQSECYKFRLTSWKREDLLLVMKKKQHDGAFPGIEAKYLENMNKAIYRLRTLAGLTTNARAASFLLDYIGESGGGLDKPESVNEWVIRFTEINQALVNYVVNKYVQNNGISNLRTKIERRRVAASVLHFLYNFKKNPNGGMPTFVGLYDDAAKACAPALLDFDIERITKLGMIEYEGTPVRMTPALVIVVCAMLGVQTEILANYESQEVLTALYALGQLVINMMETYQKEKTMARGDREKEKLAERTLNKKLFQLSVCRLTEHVPLLKGETKAIHLPMVTPFTIWINKPRTHGPDVVANRFLGQGKYSQNAKDVSIALWSELEKCGLLRHQKADHFGQAALRGYFDIWNGAYNEIVDDEDDEEPPPVDDSSRAYPFNLVQTSLPKATIKYELVRKKGEVWEYIPKVKAPEGDDCKVTFLLSTNAARIKLTKTFGHGDGTGEFYRFFFTKNELHVNGKMNFAKLPDDDAKGKKTLSTREQWKKFSKWIDDTKVDLQFLFT